MAGRLAWRSALVTGGLGGIGAAVARRFAAEGTRVLVTDLSADDGGQVTAELGAAHYAAHDVRSPGAWRTTVDAAVTAFGAIHVLVNNAGVWRPAALADVTVADAQLSFEVNQLGCLLVCRRWSSRCGRRATAWAAPTRWRLSTSTSRPRRAGTPRERRSW